MNKQQQFLFDLYTEKPPANRLGGNKSAYFHGLSGFTNKYVSSSLAFAAWRAGRDARGRHSSRGDAAELEINKPR